MIMGQDQQRPLPTPDSGESEDDFISRCISEVMDAGEAEDTDQAAAICHSQWDDSRIARLDWLIDRLRE
jgi:hypothetical protein